MKRLRSQVRRQRNADIANYAMSAALLLGTGLVVWATFAIDTLCH